MDKETKQRIIDETVEYLFIKFNNGEMNVPNIKQFTEDYQAYMSYIK